jgi:protein O-mannosyl-transferase
MLSQTLSPIAQEVSARNHAATSHCVVFAITVRNCLPANSSSEGMQQSFQFDGRTILVVIALAVMTLALFWPVTSFQFLNVDDSVYVMNNNHVKEGLNWHNVAWALTSLDVANWHPVTWLSHMLDVQLFGLDPGKHHATNLLIHTLNVIVLFLLLRSMTGALWRSAMVAALFAVHPLALESVAWIAERKNVLSTLFLLLTLWAYVWYTRKPGTLRYLLVLVFFILGLMSKAMLVTLPLALLLLDYWPLARLGFSPVPAGSDKNQTTEIPSTPTHATVLFWRIMEKLPLLLFAAGTAVLTVKAQVLDREIKVVSFPSRLANAVLSYGLYLKQAVWPSKLAIFYPFRDLAFSSTPVLLSLFCVCLITVLAIWQVRKRPYLAVGWFWYLGTLVPVVGLVHIGDISHADRYTYVPLLGVFIAIVWGAAELWTRVPALRSALITSAALSILALAITTHRDLSYWHDGISVSEHAIAVTGPNYLMERALGEAYYSQGRIDDAVAHLTRSLQIQPSDVAFYNLGTIRFRQQRFAEAAFYYQKALQYPGEPHTMAQIDNNLAVLEMQQGSLAAAEKHFRDSVALDPTSARHRVAYGSLLAREAKYDEAISQFQAAVKTAPDPLAYFSLGSALEMQHRIPEAIAAYRNTLALSPNFQEAQVRLNALAPNRQ